MKKDGIIIEAVQIKNISVALTLSSLALTKTSTGGEGFFNRMCSIRVQNFLFSDIRIVHFGNLGIELREVVNNKEETKRRLSNRLKEKHNLTEEDAAWLINSMKFEKADVDELKKNIYSQISSYVPIISGAYASIAFTIPFYKVFDTDELYITDSMFPCRIEDELAERIILGKAHRNFTQRINIV